MRTALHPATLIYDGECDFCARSVAWMREGALPGVFEFLPSQSPLRRQSFPWITDEQCAAGMQLVLPDGRTLSGDRALPEILARMNGWRHVAWLVRLLTATRITALVYRWIVRHRHLISCALPSRSRND